MKSYHQGDVNFYPLEMWSKSAKDVARETLIRTTSNRLLIQEGEITGHHHGCWFVPRPVHLMETGHGSATGVADAILAKAARGELAPARLYQDDDLTKSLKLDTGAPVIGYLVCDDDVVIRHASAEGVPTHEHGDIKLPKGGYLVTGKREWTAGDERRVAD